jgi:uncharacterized membrane protein YhaH (DUF805 family)
MNLGSLFLSPDGRLGRRDFWICILILMGASLVASRIPLLDKLIGLAVTYCGICIGSKRLHDLGQSGLLLLLPIVVWGVCFALGFMVFGGSTFVAALRGNGVGSALVGGLLIFVVLMLIAFAVVIAFTLWTGLKLGEPQTNRYGPVPPTLFGSAETVDPAQPSATASAAAPAPEPADPEQSPPQT